MSIELPKPIAIYMNSLNTNDNMSLMFAWQKTFMYTTSVRKIISMGLKQLKSVVGIQAPNLS